MLQLAIMALASFALADAKEEANRADIAKWQGEWRAVSMETDGKQSSDEQLKKIKLTVNGTNYHFQNGSFSEHGAYRFNAAIEPKQLDIVVGDGKDKGKVYQTIYRISGDELTICLEVANDKRPTDFSGRAGSGCVLEVWKRVKPGEK
jgi:uncharacterized protein (TIGR03067 family)